MVVYLTPRLEPTCMRVSLSEYRLQTARIVSYFLREARFLMTRDPNINVPYTANDTHNGGVFP